MSQLRPTLLDPLFAPLRALPGIGPKTAKLFDRLLAEPDREARVIDLLLHLPFASIDRRLRGALAEARPGETGTFRLTVEEHRPPPAGRGRAPHRAVLSDAQGGDVALVFFHGNRGAIETILPTGTVRYVSGKLELWDGRLQIVHPDRILDEAGFRALPPFEPIYPATEGLHQRTIQKAVQAALKRLPDLPDWLAAAGGASRALPGFVEALKRAHQPQDAAVLAERDPARRRLALDELLAGQVALAALRAQRRVDVGHARAGQGLLVRRLLDLMPFAPTGAQRRAIDAILGDLGRPKRMLRLLQGDVGSGKTLVGMAAMAAVAEVEGQSALMAPTEILARQHFDRIGPQFAALGLTAALLTGRDRAQEKDRVRSGLADGSIHAVIGTHALVQADVAFKSLALAVVDEQHRFGVHQRLALEKKGDGVDMLVMTATPIPRTLVLSYFGDIDISVLDEKPAGRQPIDTRALPLERLDEVIGAVRRATDSGAQVYWVCPLVQESDELDATPAEDRFAALQKIFGADAALVHGQMPGAARDAAMAKFASGAVRVLVSTTVIEVGVDVPNATVMVIEHAERFGLSQLHQLRGRVGRGSKRSACLLIYKPPLGETARARLDILRQTEDGFRIAEEDLRLRGEGDLIGARQSGLPGFKIARPEWDSDLLRLARDMAKRIVAGDRRLSGPDSEPVGILLHLFSRDEAVRLIRAG